MKARFSVEWLSQSSQAPSSSWTSPGPDSWTRQAQTERPSTTGTASESLPGFYGRRTDGIVAQLAPQQQKEAMDPVHSFANASKQETSGNKLELQQLAPESGFSSGTEEEETSGYESEGGRSLSPVTSAEPVATSSPCTGRRARTAFTSEQINSLERSFNRNAYLGAQDKAELCKRLNLSDKQIRNWFQNRRMKLKRTVQDALAHACQANVASQLLHYPELQSFRPAPYPTYYPAQETSAQYLSTHNLQYPSSTTTSGPAQSVPTLPAGALYSYRLPHGLAMAHAKPALMAPYQPYQHHHQYYSSQ